MPMTPETQLERMRAELQQLQAGVLSIHDFCQRCREHRALLDALPARFSEVIDGLLSRLEAGSMFTEESCSFSHKELHASLAIWIDKAGSRLAPSASGDAGQPRSG